ncbi:MAG TPA: response regulator [Stellaceae bacterium]|nr:response regulator [Stellaceae bacterium]
MTSEPEPSHGAPADVLEAIGDAVYAMDDTERILFANRRALELWGKTAADVVGRHLLDLFPAAANGVPYRAYRSVLRTRRPEHLETVAPALGNRWIELDVHPAPHGGLVVVFRDIDDRKRAEAALHDSEERLRQANELLERRVAERTAELEAANRELAAQIEEREAAEAQLRQKQRIESIGKLTAGIAHDFNNLLTSIIGNIELVEARLGKHDERAHRLLTAASAAAERGASLTAQLLAFSRQQRMHLEPVDLNRVITDMVPLLHSSVGATISIEVNPAMDLWPALVDAAQIELVLLNLTINSRDAMPDGGVITISTGNVTLGPTQQPEEPQAGDYVVVSVTDTGGGIAADIIDRVFDPFFTTKEVGRGSGLGLSQVLGVAQQLGGSVRIASEPGAGTIVTMFLPRAGSIAGENARTLADRAAAPIERPVGGILLVDDDPDVRAVAAAMLREAGHTVIEAGSGGAALEHLDDEASHIDLLIADLAMPGMNGFELARAARQERPDLPILFVTGFADMAQSEKSAHGTVLQKPFRADELTAKVAEALA